MERLQVVNQDASYYRARYYDSQAGRFLSEDPLGFNGDGTDFYAYTGNDPVDKADPSGCGFIDCVKALAELQRAVAELARRKAENAAAGKCDPGHDKAIEQARQRVLNALAKARTCLSAEDFKKILDSLKSLGEDLGNKIWKWLNNDPRDNWPSIYGPKPGQQPSVGPWGILPWLLPRLVPAV